MNRREFISCSAVASMAPLFSSGSSASGEPPFESSYRLLKSGLEPVQSLVKEVLLFDGDGGQSNPKYEAVDDHPYCISDVTKRPMFLRPNKGVVTVPWVWMQADCQKRKEQEEVLLFRLLMSACPFWTRPLRSAGENLDLVERRFFGEYDLMQDKVVSHPSSEKYWRDAPDWFYPHVFLSPRCPEGWAYAITEPEYFGVYVENKNGFQAAMAILINKGMMAFSTRHEPKFPWEDKA